ncbi:oxygenase MpaB family protein [Curtobacterium ammoniigenes]|uniref:oxygenase MpaB family protein n=1 Tax=Curtobacterium ammoniigenes TaxID=395387 RepID=UPI00083608C8|nr:oxygenase MpaB family protein [Curtobacterium ammoniigenes]
MADGALVLGGGAAILLQIADPVVAAGVDRHSDFAHRPQQRLVHTLMYVYAVVLGDAVDSARAAAFVERAHQPVVGANDEDRQLWVAATLYFAALRVQGAIFGSIDRETAAVALGRYAPLGTALHLPASRWPSSPAEFEAYWEHALARLTVTEEARRVARDLLFPRFAPAWIRAVMPMVRVITVGLLPDSVRTAYGFAWGAREARRFNRLVRCVSIVVQAVPGPVRRLPSRFLLRRLRRPLH